MPEGPGLLQRDQDLNHSLARGQRPALSVSRVERLERLAHDRARQAPNLADGLAYRPCQSCTAIRLMLPLFANALVFKTNTWIPPAVFRKVDTNWSGVPRLGFRSSTVALTV